jgi:hypothetical protein
MDNQIIIRSNLQGTETEVSYKFKHTIKSRRAYMIGFTDEIVDALTKDELKTLLGIFRKFKSGMNKANVLRVPFKDITPNMTPVARSRFKKKLIEANVMQEYKGKLWISPLILEPLDDKNIPNFKHWCQQAWIYLFIDEGRHTEGIEDFIEEIFA